ncbi:hypothetical protein HDU92_000514, partial [Lobulomyces angularis]
NAIREAKNYTATFFVNFKLTAYAVSGLQVDTLQVHNEAYKPYKVFIKIYT